MIKWFSLQYLKSYSIQTDVDPLTFKPTTPFKSEYHTDKRGARDEWMNNTTTRHNFNSLCEGINPSARVINDPNKPEYNPIRAIHGIMADFDAPFEPAEVAAGIKRCGDMPPNYISRTMTPGHMRFVWIFAEPIGMPSVAFATHFLKLIDKKMRLQKVMASRDEKIWDSAAYYCNSCDWTTLFAEPTIPAFTLLSWLSEAARTFETKEKAEIPMEVLRAELEEKFPKFANDWKAYDFIPGKTTGSRFWDENSAVGAHSCMLRATGFQVFKSGEQPFKSFADLVGKEFLDKYKEDKIGKAVSKIWFDGRYFWRPTTDEVLGKVWTDFNLDQLKVHFRVIHQLDKFEIDQALETIYEYRKIYAAQPRFAEPDGPFWEDNLKVLNTNTNKPIEPVATTGIKWGEGFPWIAKFYDNFFGSTEQLEHFISVLARCYNSIYTRDPLKHLTVFIAGGQGLGKNLNSELVKIVLGGGIDAKDYFLGGSQFNSHLFPKPLWRIDDQEVCATQQDHIKYTQKIKAVTANVTFTSNEKFKVSRNTCWYGLLIVTLNIDEESFRAIPNLETSITDKIAVYGCNPNAVPGFLPGKSMLNLLREEAPAFARYLLEWKTPEKFIGTVRYGIKSYSESGLTSTAKQSSPTNSLIEILQSFLTTYFAAKPEATFWKGSAHDLLTDMCKDQAFAQTIKSLTQNSIAKNLRALKDLGYEMIAQKSGSKRNWIFMKNAEWMKNLGDRESLPSTDDPGDDETGITPAIVTENNPF